MQIEQKPILITFSGGRTSAFMAKLMIDLPRYKTNKKLFVFANTGKEHEKTLEFVNKCDKKYNLNLVWIEADVNEAKGVGTGYRIVNYETADRTGVIFESVLKKYGLPSKLYRHCTRELKEVPIHKYTKTVFGNDYLTAVGIRADEKHRLSTKDNYIYPLADLNITEEIIRNWWCKQDFDLEIKDYEGNCDLCFLKSKRKKLTILKNNPTIGDWWKSMEQKYSSQYQEKFDVIGGNSISDLIEMSDSNFTPVKDKHEIRQQQNNLFDFDMDLEYNCFCKMN